MNYDTPRELRPSYEVNPADSVVQGGVLVTFPNPNTLKKRLEQADEVVELLNLSDETLPDPCIDASIIYRYDTLGESQEVQLAGTIDFFAPDDPSTRHTWRQLLRKHIDKELLRSGVGTLILEHHQSTLYAQLDDTYVTQLSFVENTASYGIEMRIERISEIIASQIMHDHTIEPDYFESHTNLDETSYTPPYELVKRFTHQWATALSGIKKTLGSPQSKGGVSTFIVNVPERIESTPMTPMEAEEEATNSSPERPSTNFDDIGGAFHAKERLRPVAYAFLYPDLASHYDIQPTSFMLHGPGGTGKTSLVHAFANSIQANLREYSSADIVSKWVGKSGERIAEIFKSAKKEKDPLVLFFDEFDSIAPKGNAGTSERQDVKNILKRELSVIAKHHPNIIVATATNNDPYDFDEPLLRAGRLQPIPVLTPTDAERAEIWQLMLANTIGRTGAATIEQPLSHDMTSEGYTPHIKPVYAADLDIHELITATPGMTGADIEQVLLSARMKAFVTAVETGTSTTLTHTDLMSAIHAYQKV
jgi:ATP-dependent Zn protease